MHGTPFTNGAAMKSVEANDVEKNVGTVKRKMGRDASCQRLSPQVCRRRETAN
jgi:hypothetical protein